MKSLSLLDPKYIGGLEGSGGYQFETAYILSQLPFWLSVSDVAAIQQEGWSDVEVFFDSGQRWMIQIKDHRLGISKLREIINDFYVQETNNSRQYSRYIVACAGLTNPGRSIHRQLERLRAATHYTESELAATRKEFTENLHQVGLGDFADFITAKVFLESELGWLKNETQVRDNFIGSLVRMHGLRLGVAEDFYLRSGYLLVQERGKAIELSSFRRDLGRRQLEDEAEEFVCFDLVTPEFLNRFGDSSSKSFFYAGAVPTWADIIHRRDVPRDVMYEILDQMKQWPSERKYFLPILAGGGEGKSTLLRRLAVELAERGEVVLYQRRDLSTANTREVELAMKLSGHRIYVLIDDAPRVQNMVGFMSLISELPFPVVVVATSRPYEWEPLCTIYSTSLDLAFAADGHEYELGQLSDHEMELLFRRLAEAGLIRNFPESDLPLAIKHYAKRTGRKLLPLLVELTQGEKVTDVVRGEIERIRRMGGVLLSAYRYICLMSSVRSFLTIPMLERLVHGIDNINLDVVSRLPGLVEKTGDRLYPRHDRIGEIVTDLLFQDADEERIDLLCKLVFVALEERQFDVVKAISPREGSIPRSRLFDLYSSVLDEAFCCGQFELMREIMEKLAWSSYSSVFSDLMVAKTPVICERIIFSGEGLSPALKWRWDEIQEGYQVCFLYPECTSAGSSSQAEFSGSADKGLQWAQVYALAVLHAWEHRDFLISIVQLIYRLLSKRFPERAAELDFHHAEFLRGVAYRESDAVELYESALARNADYELAHAGLALSLNYIGDFCGAIRHFRAARALDPSSVFRVEDANDIGDLVRRLGTLEEVIEYERDSVQRNIRLFQRFQEQMSYVQRVRTTPTEYKIKWAGVSPASNPCKTKEDPVSEQKSDLHESRDPLTILLHGTEQELAEFGEIQISFFNKLLQIVQALTQEQKEELVQALYRPRPGKSEQEASEARVLAYNELKAGLPKEQGDELDQAFGMLGLVFLGLEAARRARD